MSTKITITVEAEGIGELAAKLALLHAQFADIAFAMTAPHPSNEKPALADTPIEQAIAAAPAVEAPKPRGRKPAAGSAAPKPPVDKIFPDEAAPLPSQGVAGEGYTADMTDEEVLQLARTRAKLLNDRDGADVCKKTYIDVWPQVCAVDPKIPADKIGFKYLEGNRLATLKVLEAVDIAFGLDPISGEPAGASADPADDMF